MPDPPWRDDFRKLERRIEKLEAQRVSDVQEIKELSDDLVRAHLETEKLDIRIDSLATAPKSPKPKAPAR